MKTLSEVLRDSGLSYQTLVKYTQMGLIPKPDRVWGGRGRGSQSLYPDDVIDIINWVKLQQKLGLTLTQIAEKLRLERDSLRTVEPQSKIVIPDNPDALRNYIKAMPRLHKQIEKENPGYRVHSIRAESIEVEGKRLLVPTEIVIVPKG